MQKENHNTARSEQDDSIVSFSQETDEYLRLRFPDAFRTNPPMLSGAIIPQWTRHQRAGCQGTGCKCQQGHLHGAYYYLFQMEPGRRLRKRYIRKNEVAHVRTLVECHKQARAKRVSDRREWQSAFRQIKQNLRDTDKMMKEYVKKEYVKKDYMRQGK